MKKINKSVKIKSNHLQSIKIKAANAAIKRIVTTAKNIIRYSIGISFRYIAAWPRRREETKK